MGTDGPAEAEAQRRMAVGAHGAAAARPSWSTGPRRPPHPGLRGLSASSRLELSLPDGVQLRKEI